MSHTTCCLSEPFLSLLLGNGCCTGFLNHFIPAFEYIQPAPSSILPHECRHRTQSALRMLSLGRNYLRDEVRASQTAGSWCLYSQAPKQFSGRCTGGSSAEDAFTYLFLPRPIRWSQGETNRQDQNQMGGAQLPSVLLCSLVHKDSTAASREQLCNVSLAPSGQPCSVLKLTGNNFHGK